MDALQRKHTILNAAGEMLWGFGGNLAAPLTVLALVITRLGGGKTEVGLLSAIGTAGILLPPVVSALILQHGVGRKRFLILFHFYYMLPAWAMMGITLVLFGEKHPVVARVLLPLLYAFYIGSIGYILPVWMDWIASIFAKEIRGQAMGWASASAAAGGAAAAFVAGALASALPYPLNYSILFFIGTVFFSLSMAMYAFVRDDPSKGLPARMTGREVFARFRESLTERNFRRYLAARLLLSLGGGPIAFYAVHYKSAAGGGLAEETVIALGAAVWVAQAATSPILGRLGDRFGHKIGALLGAIAQAAGLLVGMFLPGVVGCGIAFATVGLGFATGWVSHQNLLFETCPHGSRTAHITVTNLVLAPITTLVPIATGKAVDLFGMTSTLGFCLVPVVLGTLWLLFMVREPRVVALRSQG